MNMNNKLNELKSSIWVTEKEWFEFNELISDSKWNYINDPWGSKHPQVVRWEFWAKKKAETPKEGYRIGAYELCWYTEGLLIHTKNIDEVMEYAENAWKQKTMGNKVR